MQFLFHLIFCFEQFLIPQYLISYVQEEKAKVIQTLLFVAGLNTLLQTWFGTRLPAVIGGSYTFVAPTISIILSSRWDDPDPILVRDLIASLTSISWHSSTDLCSYACFLTAEIQENNEGHTRSTYCCLNHSDSYRFQWPLA